MTRRKSILSDSPRGQNHHAHTEDRISDLPDSILGHILSLLPTKNAVASSILSKRWKLLWTTTVNLDFCCPKDCTGAVDQFVQFVNYVLLLHKPGYCNKLSLTWEAGCIPFYVNTWISAAVARDIHELFVCVKISKLPIQVQSYLFSSEKLTSLELNCSIFISSEIVFSLPILEHLELISICFQGEKAFSKLIEGCPILKYLVIHMNIGKMLDDGGTISFKCIISSNSLRHLELCAYDEDPAPDWTVLCDVQLDAPFLLYIKLHDHISNIFVRRRLVYLDEAIIQLGAYGHLTQDRKYCNSLVEALHAFGCVKTLTLSQQVTRALSLDTIKMQTEFNRLTKLELIIDWKYWSSLLDFIKLSIYLEVLIVNKYDTDDTDDSDDNDEFHFDNSNWKKTDLVPRCLSNTLQTVSIGAYDGYPDQLAMVDYILTHGSVLKIMEICFGESITDSERKYELVQEICESPKKSRICKVKFRDHDYQRNAL